MISQAETWAESFLISQALAGFSGSESALGKFIGFGVEHFEDCVLFAWWRELIKLGSGKNLGPYLEGELKTTQFERG